MRADWKAYWDELLIGGCHVGSVLVEPSAANRYGVVSLHNAEGKRIWWGSLYQGHCDILAQHHPEETFYVLAASRLYAGDIHLGHMLRWQIGPISKGQYIPNGSDQHERMFGPCPLIAHSPRFLALRVDDELLYASGSPAFPLVAWVKVTRITEGVTDRVWVTPLMVYASDKRIALTEHSFPALATELYA